ncbi:MULTISPECIES: LacI family DNA-binding transcriptional regulator [Bacillus]|uniref:LacI family DNA-binding transcriptional regulator n=1 Tax=Bacillus TaxID=1386 RepID=UPI0022376E4D|nr:LacI family DNA-binding transcriptional regulator [Bacillus pumilus]MCW4682199.1 LacI family transcriptional regulator [Bacillus pumilus]MCY7576838.1 LacI family transcriptional regulator [Bacillus pumilus]
MCTIYEIAKRCGVSTTTVSRVLNHHPYVSEEKRQLILQVMKEMEYTPSSAARTLRSHQTKTIAVSVPAVDHPFFAQFIKGISKEALDQGYKAIVLQTFYQESLELEGLQLLKRREVDGVILGALENPWEKIEPFLTNGPIVMANEYHQTADIPIIGYDEREAAYKAVDYLIQSGRKSIGFCFDTESSEAQKQRKQGYLDALSAHGLPLHDDWLFGEAFTIEDGFRLMDVIHDMKNAPDAIFTGNDQVAAGLIKQAISYGYQIPKDLAVIGYDNQDICEVTAPTITTIDIPIVELGQRSVQQIIEILQDQKPLQREHIQLPTQLVTREST